MCDKTIEEIAEIIFGETVSSDNKYGITIPGDLDDEIVFQILITFYLEGIVKFCDSDTIRNLESIDSSKVYDTLLNIGDWCKFIGFDAHIKVLNDNTNKHYCRIAFRDFENDKTFFEIKKITKPFTFIINSENVLRSSLSDYTGMFKLNNNYYHVYFSYRYDNQ
jgi:hypothetical protein